MTNEEWHDDDEPARPDASPTPNIERRSLKLIRNVWLMALVRKIKVVRLRCISNGSQINDII